MLVDAVTVHSGAQEAPLLIVALLAEDADAQSHQTRPGEMIERHPTDEPFDGFSRPVLIDDDLLFDADDPRGSIDQIDDHRTDPYQIKTCFTHS